MERPAGYQIVNSEDDVNERVQVGDLYFDTEDEEWLPAGRSILGLYVRDCAMGCIARKAAPRVELLRRSAEPVAPATPTVRRITRSRRNERK